MKKAVFTLLVLAPLLLCGCSQDSIEPDGTDETGVRGVMSIEVIESNGLTEDKLETVRFLVFKNVPAFPQLELNKLFVLPPGSGGGEVSRFKTILEVGRQSSGMNDKMVVTIVNEPSSATHTLDNISGYDPLHHLRLAMADFIETDHRSLQTGKTMPMTSVEWTDKVYSSPLVAEANPIQVEVQRVLSKIEFQVRKLPGVTFDVVSGTHITLQNTYDEQYFVYEKNAPYSFGRIQTVPSSDFLVKDWTHTGSLITIPEVGPNVNGSLLCAFYSPERTCSAPNHVDKLKAVIELKSSLGETREITLVLDEMDLAGVQTPLQNIERNSIYRVLLTVTEKDILSTAFVLDWRDEDLEIEF